MNIRHKLYCLLAVALLSLTGFILFISQQNQIKARHSGNPLISINNDDDDDDDDGDAVALVPLEKHDLDLIGRLCSHYATAKAEAKLPTETRVALGVERAKRLLPEARRRAKDALASDANRWSISDEKLKKADLLIDQVVTVLLDDSIDSDVAEISSNRPTEIHIGPEYAVDLTNDEATILVLVHELTHAAGERHNLTTLFATMQQIVIDQIGIDCTLTRAEELTCDMIAEQAVRKFITDNPNSESQGARLLRAFVYDCSADPYLNEDDEHLGQGNTLKCLMKLDPQLRQAFGEE